MLPAQRNTARAKCIPSRQLEIWYRCQLYTHKFDQRRLHIPTDYSCSACGLMISLGCYHGFGADGWFTALYCRQCGSRYSLREPAAQFFAQDEKGIREYEIQGPSKKQRIVASKESPTPTLTCEVCKAQGPFGRKVPITDEPPEGLGRELPIGEKSEPTGTCPRCKKQTMTVSENWIT
jgi:hypothetical protein